jgi:transketolase
MNTREPVRERFAAELRGEVLAMSHRAKTPHLGSSLSCIDLLAVLYREFLRIDPRWPVDPGRDRFLLGKGHAAPALYATLCACGFFPKTLLAEFAEPGAALAEQPAPGCAPGVEWATGSLGHALSAGLGMALAARMQNLSFRTVVLLGDGECNEGSVWEAALLASAQGVGSLTAIIDYNKWQATGRSDEILALAPLREKWSAFGWESLEIDGHDFQQIRSALALAAADGRDRPLAIIAHTVKGRGVSFMQDDNNWHYRMPDDGELAAARRELGLDPA